MQGAVFGADPGLLIAHGFLAQQALNPLIRQLGFFPQEKFGGSAANHLLAFASGDFGETLIHIHKALVGQTLDGAGEWAFVKRLGEALLGKRQ